MSVLLLLALSAASTFVIGLPEGTAMVYTGKYGWSTFSVSALCAAGQCIAFALLYFGGDQLMHRWKWLGREVEKVRARFASHLERRFLIVAAAAASVGVPPAVGVAALGSGFGVPLLHLLPVMYVFRAGRFAVIILFGKQIARWWAHFWG